MLKTVKCPLCGLITKIDRDTYCPRCDEPLSTRLPDITERRAVITDADTIDKVARASLPESRKGKA